MLRKTGRLLLILLAVLLLPSPAGARSEAPAALPQIALAALPAEARHTIQLIKRGGPFPYERDGVVFGNYERLLPAQRRGYYREYTVATPGARNRGARRIIAGGSGEYYYTADHYRSFQRVRE
jgi:ribonuclease T1